MKLPVNNKTKYRLLVRVFALIVVLTASICHGGFAQPATQLYNNANQLYKANQFQQAIDNYNKIIAQGYKSEEVYYDLGNCYYKLNNVGQSILFYERALKLSPKDEDAQHNLKLAKLKAVDKIQPVPQLAIFRWWAQFVSMETSTGWGIFSLASIWLAFLIFSMAIFVGGRRLANFIAFVVVLFSISFLLLAITQKNAEQRTDEAILMVPASFVKSAPDAGANDLFMIHEGVKLYILDEVGTWDKIKLEDGKVGWIEKTNFEKI
jgi:tetratricopeptide (TPR) repeat protein